MAAESQARRASAAQVIWGVVAVVASTALAAASAWSIYGTSRTALVAAVAMVIGVGSVLLGWALKWRWWGIGLLALGGYLLAVVPVAIPTAMTSPGRILRGVVDAVALIVVGWKQLLTISLPAGEYQGVFVPFFATVLVCSLIAVALMVFGGRKAPLAVVPMLVMVAFGALLGSSAASASAAIGPVDVPDAHHVLIGTLAVIVCIAWLLVQARLERASAMRTARARTGSARLGAASWGFTVRRQILAVALVLFAIGGAFFTAPLANVLGSRETPRDGVDPLLLLRQQPSPLASYRDWFTSDNYDAVLFTVEGAGDTDRIRIATLNTYDGATFTVGSGSDSGLFVREPREQEPAMTITIGEGYQGLWVPVASATAGAPLFEGARAEALADAYYASPSLNAAVIAGDEAATGGLQAGDSFRIATAAPVDGTDFSGTTGGEARISADDFPALSGWVEDQEVGRSGADLLTLIERLRERGYMSHAARESTATAQWTSDLDARADYTFQGSRAGHSGARVEELFVSLTEQSQRAGENAPDNLLVAAVGDDEQFAAAGALLAQYLGFESRVVIGVRLGSTGDSFAVRPCTDTCTGANVTAWTEVRASGGEWVAVDATPQFEVPPTLIKEGQNPPENATEPELTANQVVEPPAVASDNATVSNPQEQEEPTWLNLNLDLIVTVATIVVGSMLILLPLLVFPAVKRSRRRWRRKYAVPEVSMVGAWQELVDTYVDAGVDVPRFLTRAETADVLERPAAAAIADVVDRAVFAEHPPTRDASNAAWTIVDAERKEIATLIPWTARVKAVFTPASLLRELRDPPPPQLPALQRKDRHDV